MGRDAHGKTSATPKAANDRLTTVEVAKAKVRNSTERKRKGEERDRLLAELDATIKSVAEGLVIYDRSGRITRMNAAAESLLRYSPAQLELPVADRLKLLRFENADRKPFPVEHLPHLRALRGETVRGTVGVLHYPEGGSIWVSSSAAPIRVTSGDLLGAVLSLTDITALRELQEQQDEFMSLISHDLRTPLTILLGHADQIRLGLEHKGLKQEARGAEAMVRNAKRMATMIQELVDSARLEAGQIELHKEPVDLVQLVGGIAELVDTAKDRARTRVAVPEYVPPVLADPKHIERVITNILTNALKYSAPDAPVVVQVKQQSDAAIVSITDRGVGIPASDLPHLFTRYFRARTGKKAEGIGLGLYISRLIVEAHGGQVGVDSEVGKGSTFHVTLPLAVERR